MSAEGGKKAIIAALTANLGIAVTKFVAFAFSGSASMLAEGVHSVADSSNQILLLLGGRQAKKAATAAHPFGYGRERYVYAFVVSIVLFTVGGLFSLSEGIDKLKHPHELTNWWLPVLVLVVAAVLEGFSLRTAVRESRAAKGAGSWLQFIRRSKSPELPVVLLEDFAAEVGLLLALVGVSLTALTGNGIFDALGTIAIGLLLVAVAVILGIETKSLLVGEGASEADAAAIERAILAGPETTRIIHSKTLYLGPDDLLLAVKIAIPVGYAATDIARAINVVEARVRAVVPHVQTIYIEPDIYVAVPDGEAAASA